MKKAGAEDGAEVGRLTEAAKHIQNNVSSDTEEDSPKKSELHSKRQARRFGAHSRSLYNELNEMTSGSRPQEVRKLGRKYSRRTEPLVQRVWEMIQLPRELRVHEESQELLTIFTNMGRFTFIS